ncbi:MAG: glutamine-hydrolyzing carbamoyl-phosphate synthase small subunit [Bacteroidales bacterium]|nr:glutamine-hydrolyzing carbamoyl-phosphate synthase small subunit [Candidatus Latescibacterota bacterium]
MRKLSKKSKLILEDGSVFEGVPFGALACAAGEVVFNTGMTGYPETLTDPSYRGQLLALTYPLIGNYGVPAERREDFLSVFFESEKIQVSALVVSQYIDEHSHWNSVESLSHWMQREGVPGIAGIDTRALTRKLRESGTMKGKIVSGSRDIDFSDPNTRNLAAEVSTSEPVIYERGERRIVLVDCGVKNNIIRAFLHRDITVIRVPWDHDFNEVEADGVVLSNGPGDPKSCGATIEHTRMAMRSGRPILGVCLGSQIMALASGAETYKLRYGHRSQNQPCVESGTKRCYITSQNHGYAVDSKTLPNDWREWFYNSNDGTNEGIIHISKPFFGAQFHPEASPGPDDSEFIFDMFVRAIG